MMLSDIRFNRPTSNVGRGGIFRRGHEGLEQAQRIGRSPSDEPQ
jgi:hypothetical protein